MDPLGCGTLLLLATCAPQDGWPRSQRDVVAWTGERPPPPSLVLYSLAACSSPAPAHYPAVGGPLSDQPAKAAIEDVTRGLPEASSTGLFGLAAGGNGWLLPAGPTGRGESGTRESSRHLFALLGQRTLHDGVWSGIDEQYNLGLSFGKELWGSGISVDIGFYGSDGDSTRPGLTPETISSDVLELNVGGLKTWLPGSPLRPYFGGGVALAWTKARVWDVAYHEDIDVSPGLYARAGLLLTSLAEPFSVGVDLHYLGATSVELEGLDTDLDGWTVSVVLGIGG